MRSSLRSLRAGFTLIEVMLSTAIMVVIVMAVVSIASDSMRVYDRAVADLSTQSEARGLLDALDNDISTAVIRPDGRCWMEVVIPQGSGAPTAPVVSRVGNVHPVDQPILMLFSSPIDRPRWTSEPVGRRQLRGDVCAVAYRLGQRSPFDMPGAKIQQVYGVYRTVIDPENTFTDAFGVILGANPGTQVSPWNYWTGAPRNVHEYAPSVGVSGLRPKSLIDSTQGCWTLDEQNFIASNVVAMNLVFWCTSSLAQSTAVTVAPIPLTDPLKRPALMLRPLLPVNKNDAFDQGAKFGAGSGYRAAYTTGTSAASAADAPLHFAPTPPAVPAVAGITPHPYEEFSGRLRIFADRIYPDALSTASASTATQLPYLPYSLRAVEVSVTVLTPEGAKELATLQGAGTASSGGTKVTNNDFRRIVVQQGRSYTRYIRLLSNGG